jgi:histidine decarboxylase
MLPSVKTFLHNSVLRFPPIGYPVAVNRDYQQVIPTMGEMYNNAGDAFSKRGTCNLDRHEDERILIHRVCDMWGVDKERYWGYTTSGGSEGNLEGLWMAREKYPDGVVYYSDQAHYSIKKMTKILRLPTVVIPSDSTGAIDVRALAKSMKSGPAIILANLGTTFMGGIDDVKSIRDLCGPDVYIHADAAFLGFTLKHQFPGYDGYKYADSISVSSHKWPGVPFPGGVFICIADNVSYIENFEEVISQRDVTVSGSRNGHTAIFLNHFFDTVDLKADVESCVHVAEYLKMRLEEAVPECVPYSNDRIPIVTFNRPDDTIIRKWSLATVGLRSHVVCLPHVTKEVVDAFVHDLSERRS